MIGSVSLAHSGAMRFVAFSLLLVATLLLACSSESPTPLPSGSGGAGAGGAPNGVAGSLAGGGMTSVSGTATGGGGGGMAGASTGGGGAGGVSAGNGGGGAGGAPVDTRSDGCGKQAPAELTPEQYIRRTLPDLKTPKGAERVYEVRLPKTYWPDIAYPIVFESHGCDGSIPFHIEEATGEDAIVVALRAASNQDNDYKGGCFATGPNDAQLTEVPYFDNVVTWLEMNLCVDKSQLFMEGYSSGSWLTNLLGCVRAKTLRGQGNATGGLPKVPEVCEGPIAAIFVHDDTDDQNLIAEGIKARDRIKAINGCSDETMPYAWDTNPNTPSTCVAYQGCTPGFPVVWCPTHDNGHSSQVPLSTVGFWKFWSTLP